MAPLEDDLATIQRQLALVPDPLALLTAIFAHAPVALQLYDASGESVLVNQAFRDLFASVPPPGYNIFSDEIAARTGTLALIRRAFAGETVEAPPVWYDPRELEHVKVEHARRVAIAATFVPLLDAAGRVTYVAIFFKDLTDVTLAREQAEAESRAKDEWLATVSHELRTPLNAVLGWARILRERAHDPATLAKGLAVIERNANAQTKLVEDLLDLGRIVGGKLALNPAPVAIGPLVLAAVEAVRGAAEAKGVALALDVEDAALGGDGGTVHADPDRVQQVVWNLVTNAVKFTPPGGHVAVRVAREGDAVRIDVRDDGQGISPEFLPHLFERFRQADTGATRAHGGLGLGLAIVRHVVELHGGVVRAESEGLGKGARFVVALPVGPPRDPST